jgi:hypothetical protein
MTNPMEFRWFLKIADPVLAVRLGLAAQRDEENGCPFTAAMEWRKAAELLTFIPGVANFCWQEWERIMNLPRRLANPIWIAAPEPICQLDMAPLPQPQEFNHAFALFAA